MSGIDTVTFTVGNPKQGYRPATTQVENKNITQALFSDTLTTEKYKEVQDLAGRNGDLGVVEKKDLNAEEKIKLANYNGYGEYYDLSLSSDKKHVQIKVKETAWYMPDPTLGDIKADFGIKNNVLVQQGSIPYGNEGVINKRAEAGSSPDGRNTDYDAAELEAGDVINIPVEQFDVKDSPRGFFGRIFF